MNQLQDRRRAALCRAHEERFGPGPLRIARAPGRVNLIGEHTDYHLGYVLPMALDRDTWIAFRPADGTTARFHSLAFADTATFDLNAGPAAPPGHWTRYVHGLAAVLRGVAGDLRGIDAVIESRVPTGAGLSSSAALLIATGLAYLDAAGLELSPAALVQAAQLAEHRHAGVQCGTMDFLAAVHGHAGGPILIDCADGSCRPVPGAPPGTTLLLTQSGVKHALASSAYNDRVAECKAALGAIKARQIPDLRTLRSVDRTTFERVAADLDPLHRRRVRHVVGESERVLAAVGALEIGDAARLGALMRASHESLRDDYEVSCAEIDTLVELAHGAAGVHGSRITGGGFGGATVTLLETDAVDAFREAVAAGYRAAHGREAGFLQVTAGAGASIF